MHRASGAAFALKEIPNGADSSASRCDNFSSRVFRKPLRDGPVLIHDRWTDFERAAASSPEGTATSPRPAKSTRAVKIRPPTVTG